MNTIAISLIGMGAIGLVMSLFLLIAYKKLRVQEDPRIDQIEEILPGANCGACGYPGCRQYAEAIIKENAPINLCTVGGAEVTAAIGKLLGIEAEAITPPVAVVMCQGDKSVAPRRANYHGASSCRIEHFTTNGDKLCTYGCLGLGDCVEACQFDAMYMGDNGLPVIIEEKCTGCGLCAEACPRDIIEMVPRDQKLFVLCKNKDRGALARKYCKVACIACGICVKNAPQGTMEMRDNLAVILDYKPLNDPEVGNLLQEKCPTNAIVYRE
ncbi:MAG: electron transporter RnfB [Candidatus Hydrothermota bacterium]|nr:MAG: electron transporter RnfB [Candidatus Hydrothermae bacterium]